MIPLIMSEMGLHGWMTEEEVLDLAAIAEMTPGPIGINLATFVGMRLAGIPGMLVATLGVFMPTLTICAAAAACLEKFRTNRTIQSMMTGIRPASLGMLLGAIAILAKSSFYAGGTWETQGVITALVVMILVFRFDFSVPKVILSAGLIGLIWALMVT